MSAQHGQGDRTVEKIIEDGSWVATSFEDLRGGEVVRFFDNRAKMPLEQNGATVFIVVSEAQQVNGRQNMKVSVVPFTSDTGLKALTECPNSGNILVKPQGMDKLIEATGVCTECRYMRVCLKSRYSSEYFKQLESALGLNDINN